MSLLTPVDAVSGSASGLVVSLLVISISLVSSPPRTSGLSDNAGLCLCGCNLYPATSESVVFPLDEESENPCYYLRSSVSAKSQRHPTELPRRSTTTTGLSVAVSPIRHCFFSKMEFSIDFLFYVF